MGRACSRSFETRITGVMMRKIATLGAACCGLLSVYPSIRLSAQALHVPYQTFTLPNGLQVLLHEDHSVPLVSVNVWYHVGSSDEKPGRTGCAHLFEHIMFMGSQHVPTGEFDRLPEAARGDNNGSTTGARTGSSRAAPPATSRAAPGGRAPRPRPGSSARPCMPRSRTATRCAACTTRGTPCRRSRMATAHSTCWRTCWRAGGRHGSTSG